MDLQYGRKVHGSNTFSEHVTFLFVFNGPKNIGQTEFTLKELVQSAHKRRRIMS